jgi:hypothetical protein
LLKQHSILFKQHFTSTFKKQVVLIQLVQNSVFI